MLITSIINKENVNRAKLEEFQKDINIQKKLQQRRDNYAWFKDFDNRPKALEQNFSIKDSENNQNFYKQYLIQRIETGLHNKQDRRLSYWWHLEFKNFRTKSLQFWKQ